MPFYIKINICKCCEKGIFYKLYYVFIYMLPLILQNFSVTAYTLELKNQQILQICNFRRLSANAELCTALSVCCLLTLITKHLISQIHVITHVTPMLIFHFSSYSIGREKREYTRCRPSVSFLTSGYICKKAGNIIKLFVFPVLLLKKPRVK